MEKLSVDDIRRIKEVEAEHVNRLIEEGGEPLQREYEAGLSMWSKLRKMALEKRASKEAEDDSTKP